MTNDRSTDGRNFRTKVSTPPSDPFSLTPSIRVSIKTIEQLVK